jgi:hypothetical protein
MCFNFDQCNSRVLGISENILADNQSFFSVVFFFCNSNNGLYWAVGTAQTSSQCVRYSQRIIEITIIPYSQYYVTILIQYITLFFRSKIINVFLFYSLSCK